MRWLCFSVKCCSEGVNDEVLLTLVLVCIVMTSSNGNIFRVTGLLWGEFTGHRWIPLTKASDAELWCYFMICAWRNGWVNNRDAGDLRRHRVHYDVTGCIKAVLRTAITPHGQCRISVWLKIWLPCPRGPFNNTVARNNLPRAAMVIAWAYLNRLSSKAPLLGGHGVSNNRYLDCLLKSLSTSTSTNTSKFNITGPLRGEYKTLLCRQSSISQGWF